MAGNLYQLKPRNGELHQGQYVLIQGPYDTYGIVVKKQKTNYLIRGLGHQKPDKSDVFVFVE